ncbi:undecaprenol kinase [Candidatus Magnetoovum chiemensis]|nr:undecaprenol kinase [Candidatus Magnetoovum chiemensis]
MEGSLIESAILGIVQGITEFFPVSSTAHLILVPWFFGWSGIIDTLSFDVALHGGTLFAILIFFYKDWINIIFKKQKMLLLLIIASIPGGAAGFFLDDIVETTLRSPYIIIASLIVIGVFMVITEKVGKKNETSDDITVRDALLIGISQAVAIIPGVSRSGITISCGLLLGLKREEAARFSFLMSAPIIGGAFALHLIKILSDHSQADFNISMFTVGIIASCVTGILAIKVLLDFFKKYELYIFVYYRFALAGIIAMVMLTRGSL